MKIKYRRLGESTEKRKENKALFCSLCPYVLMKNFTKNVQKRYVDIIFVLCSNNKLDSIIWLSKGHTDEFDTTGCVYKYECPSCPAKNVGMSKRQFCIRLDDHKKFKDNTSVVSLHMPMTKHVLEFNRLLDREHQYYSRKVSEVLHITKTNNSMNKKGDTKSLRVYKNFINYFQHA